MLQLISKIFENILLQSHKIARKNLHILITLNRRFKRNNKKQPFLRFRFCFNVSTRNRNKRTRNKRLHISDFLNSLLNN